MTKQQTMDLSVQCKYCKNVYIIEAIDPNDYQKWHNGEAFIQDVMSYLSPADRELLISRTCDNCWNKMFESNISMDEEYQT